MTFLAFDTSGEMCVLTLAEDITGAVRAVSIFEGKRTLSRRLLGEMDSLLRNNGLTLGDLTAFAVGLGPGSFTGVRVGVTTAKTLAQVTGKPLVGISSLDAYAAGWAGSEQAVVPILPSRRGEVYAAVYRNGLPTEKPFAARTEEMAERLRAMGEVTVCGQSLQIPDWNGPSLTQLWTPPEGLARLAARRLAADDTDDLFSLVPLYVVPPSISTPKNPFVLPSVYLKAGREGQFP